MGNSQGKAPLNPTNVRIATEHYRTRKSRRNYPLQKWDADSRKWVKVLEPLLKGAQMTIIDDARDWRNTDD